MNIQDKWHVAVIVTADGTSHGRADGTHSAYVGATLRDALVAAKEALDEANQELDEAVRAGGYGGRHPGGYFIRTGTLGKPWPASSLEAILQ